MSDIRNVPFDFNSQQSAVEVLQVVLDDLKGTSVVANTLRTKHIVSNTLRTKHIVSNTLRTTITYKICLYSAAKEEKCDIFSLPMSNNIKTSMMSFLTVRHCLLRMNGFVLPVIAILKVLKKHQ